MIFDVMSTHLFVFEQSGACVDVMVPSIVPIQLALKSEGGTIKLHSSYMDHLKREFSWMDYFTPCLKVKLSVELLFSEYKHNIEFLGGREQYFDSPINFEVEGNKFKLP